MKTVWIALFVIAGSFVAVYAIWHVATGIPFLISIGAGIVIGFIILTTFGLSFFVGRFKPEKPKTPEE